jgi:hypothetical protein
LLSPALSGARPSGAKVSPVTAERRTTHEADGVDAGKGREARRQPIPERIDLLTADRLVVVAIAGIRQRDHEREDVIRTEAGIHVLHTLVGAEKEAARDEQQGRHRKFGGHKARQRAASARSGGCARAGLVHGALEVAADGVQRRRPAEEDGRRSGHDEGEGADAQVEIEVGPRRDLIAG